MATDTRRNKPMRLASGLLCATLLTTSIVGGTLAKYITTDQARDMARVARFGVVTSASGDLFGASYKKADADDGANTIQAWDTNAESVSMVSGAEDYGPLMVVAPGTKNDRGLTFTVKGKPEVSTRLIVDAPEGDGTKNTAINGADFVNTDIFLREGSYAVMVEVKASDVAITADNMGDFYTRSNGGTFTKITEADSIPAGDTIVYRMVQLTGNNGTSATPMGKSVVSMGGDYYPIKWEVNGEAPSTGNNVAGVKAAVAAALAGSGDNVATDNGVTTATHVPNYEYAGTPGNGLAKVTWEWEYGSEWTDLTGSNGNVLHNWENTTLTDLEDTVLGYLIAEADDVDDGTHFSKVNNGYQMAVVNEDGTATEVKYEERYATPQSMGNATSAIKNVYVAFTGETAPTNWDGANVACLTATFGARVTVEQVD